MGGGRVLQRLQAHGWGVVGADLAPAMVALARGRLEGGPVVQARLESLPVCTAGCQAAVASGVLEYVADLAGALSELGRVVASGGRVVVTLPNHGAPAEVWERRVWYPLVRALKRWVPFGRPRPPARPGPVPLHTLETLLGAAGLTVREIRYVALVPLPAPLPDVVPRLTVWLARRLEFLRGTARRLLAAQVVVTAEKTSG